MSNVGAGERNCLAGVTRDSDADEVTISNDAVCRIKFDPAGARQIDLAPRVGRATADIFGTITRRNMQIARNETGRETERDGSIWKLGPPFAKRLSGDERAGRSGPRCGGYRPGARRPRGLKGATSSPRGPPIKLPPRLSQSSIRQFRTQESCLRGLIAQWLRGPPPPITK